MANLGLGVKTSPTWVRDLRNLRAPPPKEILIFAFFGGILSTAVAATFGVTSLTLGGFATWSQYGLIWRTWWFGDAAGALIFTPFLLLWTSKARWHWSGRQLLELSVLFSGTLLTAGFTSFLEIPIAHRPAPITLLCLPPLSVGACTLLPPGQSCTPLHRIFG